MRTIYNFSFMVFVKLINNCFYTDNNNLYIHTICYICLNLYPVYLHLYCISAFILYIWCKVVKKN